MEELKVDSKILEKIQKLMTLAKDKGATQGEIENAARKAQEILFKYNLDIADVEAYTSKDELGIDGDIIDYGEDWHKADGNWIATLYNVISIHNFCKIFLHKEKRYDEDKRGAKTTLLTIVGKPDNVNIVKYLCIQLISQIRRAEKELWKVYEGHEKRGQFRRGFLLGCVRGINIQLTEQEEALQASNNKVTDLIIINDDAIDRYLENEVGDLRTRKNPRLDSKDGI